MSLDSPRVRRAGTRLAAAAAIGAVVAAAFAAPSAAAVPGITGDPVVNLTLSPIVTAGASAPGSITVDYTPAPGSEDATHAVAAELVIEGSAEVVQLTSADAACDAATAYRVHCADDEADASTAFGFDLGAVASAEDETFDYTLTVTIDGTEVASRTTAFEVVSTYDVHNPYVHGGVAVTDVTGGGTAAVNPVFYQDLDLTPTAAAVIVSFTDALPRLGIDPSGLATAFADYDNCMNVADSADPGVVCVITDFADAKGQFLTLTDSVGYAIDDDVVGPLAVCSCRYSVETVNAETLASEYDFPFEDTGNAIGLTAASEGFDGAEDSIGYYWGLVELTTEENHYDLTAEEIELDGEVGDTTTVTTTFTNDGPAAADDLHPAGDTYLARAQLPEGTELVRVDSDGEGVWECHGADELDAVYDSIVYTGLEWFDFACAIDGFEPGESAEFTFTVKLTDTTAYQGAVEIGAGREGDDFEGDFSSDFALVYNNATEARYDYDQDGYEDLLTVRRTDGALVLYKGTSSGKYANASAVSTGWGKYDIVMGGDLTGDDLPDFVARDNKTGTLYTYPGDGKGGFKSRITVGTGWGAMGQISVGNFDGDGHPDIFATAFADGNMYYYPGLGNGKFGAREAWSEFWDGMDVLSSVGDLDGDGFDEFLSRWNFDGRYYVYTSTGEVHELDQSLYDWVYTRRYDQVVGAGDLTGDGKADIVSADLKTGQLVRRSFNPEQPTTVTGTVIGSGWNTLRLPVVQLDRTYDYDYDGFSDLIAHHKTNKDVLLYWGTGAGIGSRWNMCDDCGGITAASAGGDYTSDGRTDFLYRASNGELWIAPGLDNGEIGFTTGIRSGTGWNGMSYITGGHDFNSDGKDDLIARQSSTGYLYLYKGRGNGTFESRVKIGTGWNGMREISSVGDLNHDGFADVLAIRSSNNCLYLYAGRGNGTVAGGVQVSCNWVGYDQVTGTGDFNRDGHADWLARRQSDGALYLYYGNGSGGFGSRKIVGTGWNTMSYLA
ncbi:FG-GAP repeat domain-containing protein [Glycomyces harbinensis]|uniref:Repeat domain-containing protein n=1 Tax=Glycomyces harbinensis TaxID=58114 RepID=A0A1G6YLM2_9ACTN|nr:VCBS repeat-containing protein [Glycomyces harbinensis]SDD91212.1 Repeat domain-containing protein [Glycomyces harbinensis]